MAKNLKYYNLEQLKIPAKFIKVPGKNSNDVSTRCVEIAKHRNLVGIIADPGHGVGLGIDLFKRTTKFNHFEYKCTQTLTMGEILSRIFRKCTNDLGPTKNAVDDHLVQGIAHLFKEELSKSHRPNKIIILQDVHNLNQKGLSTLSLLAEKLEGIAGILLTVSEHGFSHRIIGPADNLTFLKDLVTRVIWKRVEAPLPKDLAEYCMKRGILGEKIIERLIKNCPDYKLLCHKINEIRDKCISNGYIDED